MTTIYIIEAAGETVALADAAGQADARRLYLESLGVSARVATAREVLALRTLPVLARGEAAALPQAAMSDLFDGSAAHLLPPAAAGFAPCGRALGTCGKSTQTCGRDGCVVEVVEMPPGAKLEPEHVVTLRVLADDAEACHAKSQAAPGEPSSVAEEPAPAPAGVGLAGGSCGAGGAAPKGAGKAPIRYRNPATGETWTGAV